MDFATLLDTDPRLREDGLSVEYELAVSQRARDRIYRLRYEAYRRDGSIREGPARRFSDRFDTAANCRVFGILHGGALAASIRVHFVKSDRLDSPAAIAFPDAMEMLLKNGGVVVDPNRFVTDSAAARRLPDLPLLTMRVPLMACHAAKADWCVIAVRETHSGFYQRLFGARMLCSPRPYPGLAIQMCALGVEVERMRAVLEASYPDFPATTLADWTRLIDVPLPAAAATARFPASAG